MKKKLLTLLLAMSMVMSLCACSKEEKEDAKTETAEAAQVGIVSTKDYNAADYVTVGDFSSLEVMVDVVNYTPEDIEKQFRDEVEYSVESLDLYKYTATDKEVVEEGDIVNIDYVGKKDGVAFDGGTAQGFHLEIGSGAFIEGFEDGLVGCKVGESKTLNLTFPEEYHSEDLAGAAVTFDVTIHSIDAKEMPEITDALIASMDVGFDTIAAYKEDIENYLKESCEETNVSEKETAVWEAVYATCTVNDPPQELVDDAKAMVNKNLEMYASYYGTTKEQFITDYMGYTMEAFEEETELSAIETSKAKMAVAAIAAQAGIKLSDEDIKASAEEDYAEYGYNTADELLLDLGEGTYYDYILTEKVYEYLVGCVKIIENEPVSILADEEYEEDLEEDSEDGEVVVIDGDEASEEDFEEDPTEELILQTE